MQPDHGRSVTGHISTVLVFHVQSITQQAAAHAKLMTQTFDYSLPISGQPPMRHSTLFGNFRDFSEQLEDDVMPRDEG